MLRELFSQPPVRNLPRHTPTKKRETAALSRAAVTTVAGPDLTQAQQSAAMAVLSQPTTTRSRPTATKSSSSSRSSWITITEGRGNFMSPTKRPQQHDPVIILKRAKRSRFSMVGSYQHAAAAVRHRDAPAGLSHNQANILHRSENRTLCVLKPAKHSRFSSVGTYKNIKMHDAAGLNHDEMIRAMDLPNLKTVSAKPERIGGTAPRFEFGSHFVRTDGADVLFNPSNPNNVPMTTFPKSDKLWLRELWRNVHVAAGASIPDLALDQCQAIQDGQTILAHPIHGEDLDGRGTLLMRPHKHSRFSTVGSYMKLE